MAFATRRATIVLLAACVLLVVLWRAGVFSRATKAPPSDTYDVNYKRIQEPDKVRDVVVADRTHLIATIYFRDRKDPQHFMRVPQTHRYMKPWYESMRRQCRRNTSPDLRGIVFYSGLSPAFVKRYETDKIRFVRCALGSYTINDERFFVYHEMLALTRPRTVCITDIRDVTVNKPPHALIESYPRNTLFIGRDHVPFIEDFVKRNKSRTNLQKMQKGRDWTYLQSQHRDHGFKLPDGFRHQIVCNAGCIGGAYEIFALFIRMLRHFFLQLKPTENFNMLAVNYIVYRMYHDPLASVPKDFHYVCGHPFTSQFKRYEKAGRTEACLIHR